MKNLIFKNHLRQLKKRFNNFSKQFYTINIILTIYKTSFFIFYYLVDNFFENFDVSKLKEIKE